MLLILHITCSLLYKCTCRMYRTWPKDLLAFRTQAFGVGKLTELKGYRPGAGKERVDVVRKNE